MECDSNWPWNEVNIISNMKYRNALTRPCNKKQKTDQPKPKTKKNDGGQVERAVQSPSKSTTMPPAYARNKVNLKKALLIFSRIQNKLRLRFETLFRALAIYRAYKQLPQEKREDVPQDYLLTACMYMSMKYEQIYPPQLEKVANAVRYVKWLQLDQYRRHERTIIVALDGDLDIPTPCTVLQEILHETSNDPNAYTLAYFLMELALASDDLAAFEFKELCLAVVYIIYGLEVLFQQRKQGSAQREVIIECARQIIVARYMAIERDSAIFRKYTQECFGQVAEKAMFINQPII